MKANLKNYDHSGKNFREIKFLKEWMLLAVGILFLIFVLIFTN